MSPDPSHTGLPSNAIVEDRFGLVDAQLLEELVSAVFCHRQNNKL